MRGLAILIAATALTLGLAACSPSSGVEPPTEIAAATATTTVVPDVVGLPLDDARDVLGAAGIPIVSETDIRDGKMIILASNWTVVEQSGDATGVALGVEKPTSTPTPTPTPTPTVASSVGVVTEVVDGDTIRVDGDSVRIIGIDTPEAGACGYAESTAAMSAVVSGKTVTLTAVAAKDDVDQYGRFLRYVDVDGVDAGLRMVEQGFAIARFDSRDGYGAHPREAAYVAADAAQPQFECPAPAPAPAEPPAAPAANCDASYPGVCIPPSPPDLDCGDIPFRRFVVVPPDPHGFDGNSDGVGCES